MTRLRLTKRMRVNEPETGFIIELAKAGMSHARIAKEVYGEATEASRRRISYVLTYEEVRVTDYRNGRNSTGRAMLTAIRRDANIIAAIRGAAAGAIKQIA